MSKRKCLAGLLAITGLLSSSTAFAQSCIKEQEVKSLTLYALPTVIQAAQTRCTASLSSNGFMATGAAELASRYQALKDDNWPVARDVLIRMTAKGDQPQDRRMGLILEQMPPDTVRELLDSIILQKLSEEIQPDKCTTIEHGLEIAAPLEPEETASIFAFVLTLAAPDDMNICPVDEK
ncbi:hypothetical protein D6851_02785 [Altericroceibacterium spongiae]|uniref:Secreted protein n=1 Tax=Altericroceibacterium spongiae TaxID=2320269 RepID=A0A420ES07_9SPHN|nr:hypothetical protein [Altericroceibacterium spongiae]RKF23410.1 hypothetical protein D6851_02785 [Altericroceibacterium spongiae]